MKILLGIVIVLLVSGCGPRWGDYRFLDSEAIDATDGNMESPYRLDVETPDATDLDVSHE